MKGFRSMRSDGRGTRGSLDNPEGETKGRVLVRYVVMWPICNAHI